MKIFGIAVLAISSLFSIENVKAQEVPVRTVNVGVYETDPFVVKNSNGEYSGFDIELWRLIAQDLKVQTNFVSTDSFPDLLDRIKDKKADAALSSITINSDRHKVMDFSTPYFNSGLMIMVRENDSNTVLNSVKSFFTNDIPKGIENSWIHLFSLAFIIFIWLFIDSMMHKQFFSKKECAFYKGKDVAERKSKAMRFIQILLTLVGFVSTTFILILSIASMTSSMTADHFTYQLSVPKDLRGKNVATVSGTTSVPVLNSYGANIKAVTDINDAYEMLMAGQVDAIVYDAPTLQYYAKNAGAGKVAAVGSVFAQQPYGIALPQGSDLRRDIDNSILKMKENGVYDALYQRYFGVE